ncbi:hypothetical protein B6U74_00295 [Candidatus Bathyarchaeota archaeon ex4484_205]|nr:MAG: hypothetical protein B6U74_00295 [Candidatus Bathyarchaeota archaeon ex4484_205]RLG69444.1 MAG: hypothetical protein DRN93_00035 [archaeon]
MSQNITSLNKRILEEIEKVLEENQILKIKIELLEGELESIKESLRTCLEAQLQLTQKIKKRKEKGVRREDVEEKIMEILREKGEATASEIQKIINRTREHTSRLLKKMSEEGLIERRKIGKKYLYSLRSH